MKRQKAKDGIVFISGCAWNTLSNLARQQIEATKEVKPINRFCGCIGCVEKLATLNNAYNIAQTEGIKADILRQIKEFKAGMI